MLFPRILGAKDPRDAAVRAANDGSQRRTGVEIGMSRTSFYWDKNTVTLPEALAVEVPDRR